jgi:Pyruvate/2-oxoacid:ferredoxin oxidoreductase delta subunit
MFLPKKLYPGTRIERLQHAAKVTRRALQVGLMLLVVAGPTRLLRWYFARKRAAGEIIWLDDFTFGPKKTPAHNPAPEAVADITPNRTIKTRQSRIIKHDGYPKPDYPFAWRNPPISGNIVSGLGETAYRRPRKVFHTQDYTSPWGGMEFYLHMSNSFQVVSGMIRAMWDNRNRNGAVNPVQQPVDEPTTMSKTIKAAALNMGAVLVGITELRDHHLYEGEDLPYRYAISIAVTMDRERMLTAPYELSRLAVMDAYVDVGRIAINLAACIRSMGWDSRADTNLDVDSSSVVHVPVAIDAGLGQLGKHGSMITQAYGSNVRLATVLTNLPLAVDAPVDIGVDDFCASCQICVTNCPPHAIFDTKQLVRGHERWYVNFDRCTPYFSDNGGCGICIEVCPWSEEGRGSLMTEKLLARRKLHEHR